MKKVSYLLSASIVSVAPFVALADSYSDLRFVDLVGKIVGIINQIIPVLVSLTVFLLLAGVARYIFTAGDSDTHKEGFNLIMYGVLGLFVMFSVWGLINLAINILGLTGSSCPGGSGGFC